MPSKPRVHTFTSDSQISGRTVADVIESSGMIGMTKEKGCVSMIPPPPMALRQSCHMGRIAGAPRDTCTRPDSSGQSSLWGHTLYLMRHPKNIGTRRLIV
ncbi:hypothetical protein EVAR_46068_1 [Eumeta japonica]|uniref:Uncharacterized protein n=1 Tax=Eumeta variegata TaxID=151549 RepID=A0A4C1SM37_EUMVA|nr:hypothetical protein EVAR_46068_1 [Eumeta japonica]